jgi:hypothetical protein
MAPLASLFQNGKSGKWTHGRIAIASNAFQISPTTKVHGMSKIQLTSK